MQRASERDAYSPYNPPHDNSEPPCLSTSLAKSATLNHTSLHPSRQLQYTSFPYSTPSSYHYVLKSSLPEKASAIPNLAPVQLPAAKNIRPFHGTPGHALPPSASRLQKSIKCLHRYPSRFLAVWASPGTLKRVGASGRCKGVSICVRGGRIMARLDVVRQLCFHGVEVDGI